MKKSFKKVNKNGTYWFKDKKCELLHRENGPAVELNSGISYWYRNGKLHRTDGPAIFGMSFHSFYVDGICVDNIIDLVSLSCHKRNLDRTVNTITKLINKYNANFEGKLSFLGKK